MVRCECFVVVAVRRCRCSHSPCQCHMPMISLGYWSSRPGLHMSPISLGYWSSRPGLEHEHDCHLQRRHACGLDLSPHPLIPDPDLVYDPPFLYQCLMFSSTVPPIFLALLCMPPILQIVALRCMPPILQIACSPQYLLALSCFPPILTPPIPKQHLLCFPLIQQPLTPKQHNCLQCSLPPYQLNMMYGRWYGT